ncbi:MAG: FAD-binding dehydrogenase, partial [Brevundimonas sp.]
MTWDAIIIGAGLAGLVAADELVRAGRRVAVLDQETPANLGGQAWWSFGGLFLVDSPEQRRLGVRDSFDLAWSDWRGSAGWDRLDGALGEDVWAERWGREYVAFAAGEKRDWLRRRGVRLTPMVGWAERGDGRADGHGNSAPRFHVAWGCGLGVVDPFAARALAAAQAGRLTFHHRHRVDALIVEGGRVSGVSGAVLAPDDAPRGAATNRTATAAFSLRAPTVLVATGGIGGDPDKVRRWWPERLGRAPREMIAGTPAYVDGRMLDIARAAGARIVNRDRMWHYVEGVRNWDPVWPKHGIRILPGPSSVWLDALGRRLTAPALPGYDTLSTLRHLRTTTDLAAHDHSWFILTQAILEKEFALSGSEQNGDIVSGRWGRVLSTRLGKGASPEVEAFKRQGADFVVADDLETLVGRMNALTGEALLDPDRVRAQIEARDAQMANPFSKDVQVQGIHNARRYLGDRLARVARPHRIL